MVNVRGRLFVQRMMTSNVLNMMQQLNLAEKYSCSSAIGSMTHKLLKRNENIESSNYSKSPSLLFSIRPITTRQPHFL